MWKHGTSVETPAQYKRRYSQGGTDIETQTGGRAKGKEEKVDGLRGLLKKLWS
jgi:hypothetical protein